MLIYDSNTNIDVDPSFLGINNDGYNRFNIEKTLFNDRDVISSKRPLATPQLLIFKRCCALLMLVGMNVMTYCSVKYVIALY